MSATDGLHIGCVRLESQRHMVNVCVRMCYENGDVYEGSFVRNEKSGQGR